MTVNTVAGPVGLARPKLRRTNGGVRVPAVRRACDQDQCARIAGDRLVRAWPPRPGRGGGPGRGAGGSGRDLQVHRLVGLPADQGRLRDLVTAPLDGVALDYLFLDASFFRMHPGSRPSGAGRLGHHHQRQARSIGLAPGTGESADAWTAFLTDLKDRGLASPLLVISDGAPGLIAAIEQAYPKALRQRCVIHRCRNILAKIPAGMQAEVKDAYWKIFGTGDLKTAPGPKLVDLIDARISEMAARYAPTYPAAMKALTTDAAGLTAYLGSPPSTITASGTPTSSSAPSARPAAAPRSSAGSPARPAASPSSGPSWTAPRRLAGREHDPRRAPAAAGPAPVPARPAHPAAATHRHHQPARRRQRNCHYRRLTCS